jgi:AcrR family transcriptional regulator
MTLPERGRPRDASLDGAILNAVRDILSDKGYERLSVQEVTRKCGVHVRTITRRWSTKAALVAAAVLRVDVPIFSGEDRPDVPTGNLRPDIRQLVAVNLRFVADPAVHAALPALWSAMLTNREVADLFARREQEWIHAVSEVLAAAVASGDAPPRTTKHSWLVPQILGGATFYSQAMSALPADAALVDGLTDFVVAALLA